MRRASPSRAPPGSRLSSMPSAYAGSDLPDWLAQEDSKTPEKTEDAPRVAANRSVKAREASKAQFLANVAAADVAKTFKRRSDAARGINSLQSTQNQEPIASGLDGRLVLSTSLGEPYEDDMRYSDLSLYEGSALALDGQEEMIIPQGEIQLLLTNSRKKVVQTCRLTYNELGPGKPHVLISRDGSFRISVQPRDDDENFTIVSMVIRAPSKAEVPLMNVTKVSSPKQKVSTPFAFPPPSMGIDDFADPLAPKERVQTSGMSGQRPQTSRQQTPRANDAPPMQLRDRKITARPKAKVVEKPTTPWTPPPHALATEQALPLQPPPPPPPDLATSRLASPRVDGSLNDSSDSRHPNRGASRGLPRSKPVLTPAGPVPVVTAEPPNSDYEQLRGNQLSSAGEAADEVFNDLVNDEDPRAVLMDGHARGETAETPSTAGRRTNCGANGEVISAKPGATADSSTDGRTRHAHPKPPPPPNVAFPDIIAPPHSPAGSPEQPQEVSLGAAPLRQPKYMSTLVKASTDRELSAPFSKLLRNRSDVLPSLGVSSVIALPRFAALVNAMDAASNPKGMTASFSFMERLLRTLLESTPEDQLRAELLHILKTEGHRALEGEMFERLVDLVRAPSADIAHLAPPGTAESRWAQMPLIGPAAQDERRSQLLRPSTAVDGPAPLLVPPELLSLTPRAKRTGGTNQLATNAKLYSLTHRAATANTGPPPLRGSSCITPRAHGTSLSPTPRN